jgi:hypothetical protein
MKNTLLAALALALLGIAGRAMAGDAPAWAVDLNEPGAMERLEQANPGHYETIRRIMAGLFTRDDREVPRWLQTTFAAHEISYAPILLTSAPAQRRLAFALDGTRYRAVVTLSHVRGVIVPAE